MKFKPYKKYKDSKIQWIGEIPENWQIDRLKFLLSTIESGGREEGGGANLEKGAFSLGGEHVNWDGTLNLENERFISEEYYNSMNKGKIKLGDILLVKDGATIGKTAILNKKPYKKMAVNEHVFLMRPNKKINSKLLYYLICGDSGFTQIKLTETGSAQGGINLEFPDIVLVTIPEELEEQEKLFSFLDSKTSQINQTIEKDKQLINLLKEKRTALINHVVTKGLNPKAKMKDSGIEWIGEVPEEWEVRKLKHVLMQTKNSIKTGPFGSQLKSDEMEDSEVKVYNQRNVLSKDEKFGENFVSKEKYEELISFKVDPKDLLITTRGTIGKCLRLSEDAEIGILHPCLMKIKTDNKIILDDYIEIIIEESDLVKTQFYLQSNATTIEVIYQDNLKEVVLFVPKIGEQKDIIEYLDKSTSKIDQTIKKIEEKIELLEEYKKSLIHHVVTGKVDVREVAA